MNLTLTRRVLAAGAGVGTAALLTASMGTASATTPPEPATVSADLDGIGVNDTVTLAVLPSGQFELSADLGTMTVRAPVGDGTPQPLVDPRPTDVNSDGTDEVLVPEFVGANTLTFHLWAYDPARGLYETTTPDGAPLAVYEGGGIATRNGYECPADHDGRALDLVSGSMQGDPGNLRYDGERVTYLVQDGVATPVYTTPFTGVTVDDPVLATDPASCAPVS